MSLSIDYEGSVLVPVYFILKIESAEGRDTFIRCGNESQDYLFAIASVSKDGVAEIVDNGYRTEHEARAAWSDVFSNSASGHGGE